jgi:hypothetical protein
MKRHLVAAAAAAAVLALVPRPAAAQNLLANPGFDQNLSGWFTGNFDPQRSSLDANGSAHSGSAQANVAGGTPFGGTALHQCVPITAGTTYDFSFKVRMADPVGRLVGILQFFPNAGCNGASLSGNSFTSQIGKPNSWHTVHFALTAPAGAVRASVQLSATNDLGPQTILYDDVYFGPAAPTGCTPGPKALCLDNLPGDARFRVRATFNTVQAGGKSGQADAIALDSLGVDHGGLFWFFSLDNPEVLVKVLDRCQVAGHFWVFISAGTNVGVNLFIDDTHTGAVALFHNPDLGPFPAIQNLFGLPCANRSRLVHWSIPEVTMHRILTTVAACLALVPCALDAQNLLVNPGFDDNLSGWTPVESGSDVQHSPIDANTSVHSGSARATNFIGSGSVLSQCVTMAAGTHYAFSLKTRLPDPINIIVGRLRFFANASCSGEFLDHSMLFSRSGQPNSWHTVHRTGTAPNGTIAVLAILDAPFGETGFYDDVYFGRSAPLDCIAGPETLCIDHLPGDARFQVRATFSTVQAGGMQGDADAIALDTLGVDHGGLFWFFSSDNPEVLIKILDRCVVAEHFWVFVSAGTNVGVELFVADTHTRAVALFHNPDLGPFPAIQNLFGLLCEDL